MVIDSRDALIVIWSEALIRRIQFLKPLLINDLFDFPFAVWSKNYVFLRLESLKCYFSCINL